MSYFWRPLQARPWQALLEALSLATFCWLGLLLAYGRISFLWTMLLSLLADIAALLLCTLRLRLSAGSWREQGFSDLLPAILLGLSLSSLELLFTLLLLRIAPAGPLWQSTRRPLLVALIALCLDLALFAIFRTGIRFYALSRRLRRARLFWSLTYTQVMSVAVGTGALIVVLEAVVIYQTLDSFISFFTALGLILFGLVSLIVIVLPFALSSYLIMRRVTGRLQALGTATSALRAGDYTRRIQVTGEDEVAHLQADFNAMAAELERAVLALQKERDTVAALLQSRRELVATVSHELRTPMATLRSYLESVLLHWNERGQDDLHADLQIMESEVIHLQKLVDDLFALSRAEIGKLAVQSLPLEIGPLLSRTAAVITPLAWQKNKIEVVAEIAPKLPAILVDPGRLQQVLQNLLHNAVRHTSPGGIVAISAQADEKTVTIQVRDTGKGIPPEALAHIWKRYYQSEQHARLRESGIGLGLALVKEWIEAMGGSVAVESVVGQGSCFTLSFPRADPQ
jgi:signal transduction histidine kinase